MNQRHHIRSSSHGKKLLPAHARSSKAPAVLRRNQSYNNAPSHGQSGKVDSGVNKSASAEVANECNEEEDVASFLQFCATCERQIITPGSSVLYCSEACRRQDNVKFSSTRTSHLPPLTPASAYFDTRLPDIVPQRSPTVPRPLSLAFSDLSIDEPPTPEEDDDQTQFHSGSYGGDAFSGRPRSNRASTATDSSNLPSLIHSPSSSLASTSSAIAPRPMPSRHNKSYSIYSNPPLDLAPSNIDTAPSSPTQLMKGSSLQSTASTQTAFYTVEGADISYGRRPTTRRGSEVPSSLKQLFSHHAMTAPPT